jgi:monovalent cation/hydrogen antiporter
MPGFHGIRVDSQVMLSVVVPPLLHSAALDFSFPTFLRNIRAIVGLGVGLVVITAFAFAGVTRWLLPSIPFATALVWGPWWRRRTRSRRYLGRELGLPRKVMAILTGESLAIDAAALELFTVAVDRVAGGHAIIGDPLLLFAYRAVPGVGGPARCRQTPRRNGAGVAGQLGPAGGRFSARLQRRL